MAPKMTFAGMSISCTASACSTVSEAGRLSACSERPLHRWPALLVDKPQHVLVDSLLAECKHYNVVCRYHTGPGFFVNTYLVFLTVSASIWVYLLLALAGAQTFACPTKADPQKMCSTLTGAAAQPFN